MAGSSSVKSPGRLAGLACLAIILFSSAGYLAVTGLLTGDSRAPFGYAAFIGGFGTCPWLLMMGANEPAAIRPLLNLPPV